MKVTVFGTGYVGLVQAAVLAEVGNQVLCIDIDENKIARLKKGEIPIYEPGLESLVESNVEKKHLHFSTNAAEGVAHGDIVFIAVGTPPVENGSADLRYVFQVADTIGDHMQTYKLVVNKSTVPVGTGAEVAKHLRERLRTRKTSIPFDVVSNPEFLKEGAAINDCMKPDRIILGVDSQKAEDLMRELYAPFNRNHDKVIVMDVPSAELTKYAANAMLATKISFMNEMANLAEALGADIESVRQGIGSDPRIGYHFIYPGCGYGGSCFPKDVRALMRTAQDQGFDPLILKAVEHRNNAQKQTLFSKISAYFGGDLEGKCFALWGLAFKPGTDDMREAPSRVLMESLWEAGADVRAYDPKAMAACRGIYGEQTDLELVNDKDEVLKGADALIIVTDWQEFKAPDFSLIKAELNYPVIFDGRNLYDPASMRKEGIHYQGVGRIATGQNTGREDSSFYKNHYGNKVIGD